MSDPSGSSEDDGDYAFGDARMTESKRYPIHDCCEFEDADALRVSVVKLSKGQSAVHTSFVDALDRARRRITDGRMLDATMAHFLGSKYFSKRNS